uniref:Uncharacterized protein n=1 Tax=viral metagenome TaxID=1070528 RepID=A0A6M3JJN4_9ZZZZ
MKHEGYTPGKWISAPWFYENGKYRKMMIQTDTTAVAEVLELYRPDDLENKEMIANTRLLEDAPRLAEEVGHLRMALHAIAEMVVTPRTNHAELSALCIFIAKEALERRK